jgi:glycosyltransferase involved in cell wall biosynthesis
MARKLKLKSNDAFPRFSLVIPAYNEEKNIVAVLESLAALHLDCEILVINDGSKDDTGLRVSEYLSSQKDTTHIHLHTHPYNKGYGSALKSGIRLAKTNYVMFIDADGQHNAGNIELLLAEMEKYDMVVGQRVNSASPLIRRPGMKVLRWIAEYLAGRKIPDLNSGFRVMKRDVVEKYMHILPNGFSFTTTITLAMFEGGYSVGYVPIEVRQRVGKSTVNFRDAYKMLLLILRTITLFNPLKVFLPGSISLFLLGTVLFVRDALRMDITLKTTVVLIASILVFFFGLLSDQVSNLRRERRD